MSNSEAVETTAKKAAKPKVQAVEKESATKEPMMYVGPTIPGTENAASDGRGTERMPGDREFISANHEIRDGRTDDPEENRIHLYSVQ